MTLAIKIIVGPQLFSVQDCQKMAKYIHVFLKVVGQPKAHEHYAKCDPTNTLNFVQEFLGHEINCDIAEEPETLNFQSNGIPLCLKLASFIQLLGLTTQRNQMVNQIKKCV